MNTERVLVVPAALLWDSVAYKPKGLITERADQLSTVVAHCGIYLDRPAAENDPSYKQIIPYAVIRHLDSYFLLQRKRTQGEQRLHDKLSIGVGGHINPSEDNQEANVIESGLARELNEEVYIGPGYEKRFIGLINDDTTEVGRVHLGVLFEIESPSNEVAVRETDKMEGKWAFMGTLQESYARLETWSQIAYDAFLSSQLCTAQSVNGR